MQNLVIFFQSANISLSASMCTCRDERRRSKWLTTAAINTKTWKLAVAAFHVRVLFLALTGRICWKDSLLPHVRITLTNHRAWHSIPGTNCLDNKSVQLGIKITHARAESCCCQFPCLVCRSQPLSTIWSRLVSSTQVNCTGSPSQKRWSGNMFF